jgi:Putative DNA-binding domain
MTGGKLGDDAKDALAAEIIAFANTVGGTIIVGIDEDTATKRAKPPIFPIPRCKDLAARLHQAIGDRVEPKLPVFECEGLVTEDDGSSGVIIMRTLESYLAPHRHTQDNHCYIRRNDRAEPMSMLEIQELTRQKARSAEDAERAFAESSERFFSWIPENRRRTHPGRGVQGQYETKNGDQNIWVGLWAMRLTARPFAPLAMGDLPLQPWLESIKVGTFKGSGQLRDFWWDDLKVVRTWQPRLRGVDRAFQGDNSLGLDRISANGLIERFVRLQDSEEKTRPKYFAINITQLIWNVASVIQLASIVRAASSRPTQHFALEVEFMSSDPLLIYGYASSPRALIPPERVLFPHYEIGDQETFNDLLKTFDKDVWNLGGHHPTWDLGVFWSKCA